MTNNSNLQNPDTNRALISAGRNRRMFNIISPRYDLLNRLLSLGMDQYWRRQSIKMLHPSAPGKFLDIGCGTGDLSIMLGKINPAHHICGCDPAVNMLHLAQKKINQQGLNQQISLSLGDALTLPFANETFNGTIMGFCIRNVTDRTLALQEMYRVLKPDGKCVILELTTPNSPPLHFLYHIYTNLFIPFIASLLSHSSAYAYLNKSISVFPESSLFKKMMEKIGFTRCVVKPFSAGLVTIFSGKKMGMGRRE